MNGDSATTTTAATAEGTAADANHTNKNDPPPAAAEVQQQPATEPFQDEKFFLSQDFMKLIDECGGIDKLLLQTKDGKTISANFHSLESMDPSLFKSVEDVLGKGTIDGINASATSDPKAKTIVEVSTLRNLSSSEESSSAASSKLKLNHQEFMKSTEWVRDLQKDHVDVSYSQIFTTKPGSVSRDNSDESAETGTESGQSLPPKKRSRTASSESSSDAAAAAAAAMGVAPLSSAKPQNIPGLGTTAPRAGERTDWTAMYQMAMYQNAMHHHNAMMHHHSAMQRNYHVTTGHKQHPATTATTASTMNARFRSNGNGSSSATAAVAHRPSAAPAAGVQNNEESGSGDTSLPLLVAAAAMRSEQIVSAPKGSQKGKKQSSSMSSPEAGKKGRKPRKIIPEVKEYVDRYYDNDILFGRGGRSNHHPGNKKYRDLIVETQAHYRSCDKSRKTEVAQNLVDRIKNEFNSRFLELDPETNRWYIVPNIVARRKCGQALRENNTAEARMAKRARYSGRVYGTKAKETRARARAPSPPPSPAAGATEEVHV